MSSFSLSEVEIPELLIESNPKSQLQLYRKIANTGRVDSLATRYILSLVMSQRSQAYADRLASAPPSALNALGEIIPDGLKEIRGEETKPISSKQWALLHDHLSMPYESLMKGRKRKGHDSDLDLLCENRDYCCPITHKVTETYASRIINSTASSSVSRDHSAYWVLLRLILGDELADFVWSVSGADKDITNIILLEVWTHRTWQNGSFQLYPVEMGRMSKLGKKAAFLDLELSFVEDIDWDTFVTTVSKDPEQQWVSKHKSVPRLVNDGDRFRIITEDIEKNALPSATLLYVRYILFQFIRESGQLRSAHRRKRVRMARDFFSERNGMQSSQDSRAETEPVDDMGDGVQTEDSHNEEEHQEDEDHQEDEEVIGEEEENNMEKITFSQFFPPPESGREEDPETQ